MTRIRQDKTGLFIKTGGYIFRPGKIDGYAHAYDMSDTGVLFNTSIKAKHIGGSPLAKLELHDGSYRYWANEYQHELQSKRVELHAMPPLQTPRDRAVKALAAYLTGANSARHSIGLQVGGKMGAEAEQFFALRAAFGVEGWVSAEDAEAQIARTLGGAA